MKLPGQTDVFGIQESAGGCECQRRSDSVRSAKGKYLKSQERCYITTLSVFACYPGQRLAKGECGHRDLENAQ